MNLCFYNCSRDYINSIDGNIYGEIKTIIEDAPQFETQEQVNSYLFERFTEKGWSYDNKPSRLREEHIENDRSLCLTSTTLQRKWRSDYAKMFGKGLVQIEIQFGKVEAMFKDFCGFQIAHSERRLALGVEVVMNNPNSYFRHRKEKISGMANFAIAKETLPLINFNCPIWLIGMGF